MTKYRTLAPGDGTTGPTGLEYRNLTNDMIPGETYPAIGAYEYI